MLRVRIAGAALATLALFGCAGGGSTGSPYGSVPPASPDTVGTRMWAYLESARFREWPLWPGRGELHRGTEPHGALLTTRLNPPAHDALIGRAPVMPPGAVIVKENFTSDSVLASITMMYKAPGYAPSHGDWFWMKTDANGAIESAGRIRSCIDCHGSRARNDYIQTAALTGG